jgi:lipopolysaccharide transport system ATP-binding protein
VAAHLEPEILLIDEVLAVGDFAFQNKSLNKMGDVVKGGRTVFLVSHNMAAIKALCQSAIYLEKGQAKYIGEVDQAIEKYLGAAGRGRETVYYQAEPDSSMAQQILSINITDEEGNILSTLAHDQPFRINIKFALREPVNRTFIAMHIVDSDLQTVLTSRDFEQDESKLYLRKNGMYTCSVHFSTPLLVPGSYRLNIQIVTILRRGETILTSADHVCSFEVIDNGSLFARAGVRWTGKVMAPVAWTYESFDTEGTNLAPL